MPEGPRRPVRDRAARGLTWAIRGLEGFLALAVLTAVGLIALIPAYGLPSPTIDQRVMLGNALLVLSWFLLILGVGAGLAYCVGLAGLWGSRRELGREHAVSVERTLPWLAVTMVLLATGIVVPSLTGPFLTFPGIGSAPPDWATSLSVVLAGMRAIFAGLTLYYAVQGLAQEDARVRLLVAMSLGAAGAIVWSGLAAFAAGSGLLTIASLLPFLAGIVAGLGTSAISIGLFILIYREIRSGLAAERTPSA
ncbi:MAG TPA: hypothetical protein VEY12_11450 [Thermoplasmata archaeon]|nr:hypothetical protein [Thermoplasmata archaeon]